MHWEVSNLWLFLVIFWYSLYTGNSLGDLRHCKTLWQVHTIAMELYKCMLILTFFYSLIIAVYVQLLLCLHLLWVVISLHHFQTVHKLLLWTVSPMLKRGLSVLTGVLWIEIFTIINSVSNETYAFAICYAIIN